MMLQGTWSPAEASGLLGALQGFLTQEPNPPQAALLALCAQRLRAAPAAGAPTELLEALAPPARQEALRLLVTLSCLRSPLEEGVVQRLSTLAAALKVRSPWPGILAHARAGHGTRATLAMARLSPDAKALLRQVWKGQGLLGVLRAMRSANGKGAPIPEVAARYAALERLPRDTLGFAFHAHMRARSLPLPGERGGLIEQAMQHDLMHVVTGCDTDARGEGRLAGFYTGVSARHPVPGADPFTFVMVALMTFQLGFKVGPTFVGADLGVVDPVELFAGIEVGSRAPLSPLTDWRFQEDFAAPLLEVRRRFGLHPEGLLAMFPAPPQQASA